MDKIFTEEVWKGLATRLVLFLPQLCLGVLVLIVFWLAAAILGSVLSRIANTREINQDLLQIAIKCLKWSLLAVGIVTSLGTMGIDVGALVAGLGLTGFALSIALKDIISNVLAGVMIIAYKPFQRHDRIIVQSLEGTVAQIDLRYTTLQLDDRKILVPNSNLLTNSITVVQVNSLKKPNPRA